MDHTTPDNLGKGPEEGSPFFPEVTEYEVPPMSPFEVEVARGPFHSFVNKLFIEREAYHVSAHLGAYAREVFDGDLKRAWYFLQLEKNEGRAFVFTAHVRSNPTTKPELLLIVYVPRDRIYIFMFDFLQKGLVETVEMADHWLTCYPLLTGEENEG